MPGPLQLPTLSSAPVPLEMQNELAQKDKQLEQLNLYAASLQQALHQEKTKRELQTLSQDSADLNRVREEIAVLEGRGASLCAEVTKASEVSMQLNAWFVENAPKMRMTDTASPSAYLEQTTFELKQQIEGVADMLAQISVAIQADLEEHQQQCQETQSQTLPAPAAHASTVSPVSSQGVAVSSNGPTGADGAGSTSVGVPVPSGCTPVPISIAGGGLQGGGSVSSVSAAGSGSNLVAAVTSALGGAAFGGGAPRPVGSGSAPIGTGGSIVSPAVGSHSCTPRTSHVPPVVQQQTFQRQSTPVMTASPSSAHASVDGSSPARDARGGQASAQSSVVGADVPTFGGPAVALEASFLHARGQSQSPQIQPTLPLVSRADTSRPSSVRFSAAAPQAIGGGSRPSSVRFPVGYVASSSSTGVPSIGVGVSSASLPAAVVVMPTDEQAVACEHGALSVGSNGSLGVAPNLGAALAAKGREGSSASFHGSPGRGATPTSAALCFAGEQSPVSIQGHSPTTTPGGCPPSYTSFHISKVSYGALH